MTKEERYKKFEEELENEYDVEQYQGRGFYNGPAVRIDSSELQDVIRATTVRVQWDTLGKDKLVVYPK